MGTGEAINCTLDSDPVLSEIVRRLVAAYEPERIYLFGSKARGDEGPDSDYDLLVVVPDGALPDRKCRMIPSLSRKLAHGSPKLFRTCAPRLTT